MITGLLLFVGLFLIVVAELFGLGLWVVGALFLMVAVLRLMAG